MNKYVIGVIVLVVAGLLVLGILNSNSEPEENTTPEVSSVITITESNYDFGDIDIFSGKVSTTYLLKNEGVEDVSILDAITSCMCTEGEIGDLLFGMHGSSGDIVIIPAGGEQILKATFDPLAHGPEGVGKIKRELFLQTNSTVAPEIKVTFSANVTKNETE